MLNCDSLLKAGKAVPVQLVQNTLGYDLTKHKEARSTSPVHQGTQKTHGRLWPLAVQNIFTPRQEGMGQVTKGRGSICRVGEALRRGDGLWEIVWGWNARLWYQM